MRMMYYMRAKKKVSNTFEKVLGNNSFNFKFIVRKIHQAVVNKSYYLVDYATILICLFAYFQS